LHQPYHHFFSVPLNCGFQLPFQFLWWPAPSVTIYNRWFDFCSFTCSLCSKAVIVDKCFLQQSKVLQSLICVCLLLPVSFAIFSWHSLLPHQSNFSSKSTPLNYSSI
jgi:hypothetical protein